jgi:hypothetical protein
MIPQQTSLKPLSYWSDESNYLFLYKILMNSILLFNVIQIANQPLFKLIYHIVRYLLQERHRYSFENDIR